MSLIQSMMMVPNFGPGREGPLSIMRPCRITAGLSTGLSALLSTCSRLCSQACLREEPCYAHVVQTLLTACDTHRCSRCTT